MSGDLVFETVIVILLLLWLLGVVTAYNLGGFIHLLPGAVLAFGLSACGQDARPALGEPVRPETAQAAAAPSSRVPDTSVPDAATAFAAQDAAERAKALPAVVASNKPDPPTTMTPAQESKSMPMAGQANDHSVPATAKQRGN